MDFKLVDKNIFEFYDNKLISKNQEHLNGIILYFPFKNLCYKSFNFFWYLPYKRFEDINIDNLINIIKIKETSNGSNFIEGTEVYTDGPYNLNFINLNKLKYQKTLKIINNNLSLIYLELFL